MEDVTNSIPLMSNDFSTVVANLKKAKVPHVREAAKKAFEAWIEKNYAKITYVDMLDALDLDNPDDKIDVDAVLKIMNDHFSENRIKKMLCMGGRLTVCEQLASNNIDLSAYPNVRNAGFELAEDQIKVRQKNKVGSDLSLLESTKTWLNYIAESARSHVGLLGGMKRTWFNFMHKHLMAYSNLQAKRLDVVSKPAAVRAVRKAPNAKVEALKDNLWKRFVFHKFRTTAMLVEFLPELEKCAPEEILEVLNHGTSWRTDRIPPNLADKYKDPTKSDLWHYMLRKTIAKTPEKKINLEEFPEINKAMQKILEVESNKSHWDGWTLKRSPRNAQDVNSGMGNNNNAMQSGPPARLRK